jgi:hypothetical protein
MFFKTQNFGLVVKTWLKVETGRGRLGGISGTLGMEGRRECCGYSEVFYVVALAYVSQGPRGRYPLASIELTDRMPVIWVW